MRIYLITHAHTEQARDVAVDRWTLSQRGTEEASKLAEAPFWRSVTRIVVSAEQKTYLTVAEIANERSLPIWVDSRFDELRRAGWTENYAAQVEAVFAEPAHSVGSWESAESVRKRLLNGLSDLQQRFKSETLALVGHGLSLSILRAEALRSSQIEFQAWQRLAFGSHASINLNPLDLISDFAIDYETVR